MVLRRDYTACVDEDVVAAQLLQFARSRAGTSVLWPPARVDTPSTWTSFSAAMARGLGGRLEQRPDVDVESEIGECGGDDSWRRGHGRPDPSWRPGCADGGPPAAANSSAICRGLLEIRDRSGSPRSTRRKLYGSPPGSGRRPSRARWRSRPAWRVTRAALTAELQQIAIAASRRRSRQGLRARARPPQCRGVAPDFGETRSCDSRTAWLSTSSTSSGSSLSALIFVHARRWSRGRNRCAPGGARRLPRCASWAGRSRWPWPCRRAASTSWM